MALSNQKCSLAHSSAIYLQDFLLHWNLSVYQCSITPTHIYCHIIRLRRIEISRFYLSNVSNIRDFFKLFLFIFIILAPVRNWPVRWFQWHVTASNLVSGCPDDGRPSWTDRKYNIYSFSRPITNTIESALFTLAISNYKIDAKKGMLF